MIVRKNELPNGDFGNVEAWCVFMCHVKLDKSTFYLNKFNILVVVMLKKNLFRECM